MQRSQRALRCRTQELPECQLWSEVMASYARPQAHRHPPHLFTTTFLFYEIGGHGSSVDSLLSCSHSHAAIWASDTYNKMFSIHGIIMVFFFFLVPVAPSEQGNFPGHL